MLLAFYNNISAIRNTYRYTHPYLLPIVSIKNYNFITISQPTYYVVTKGI